VELLFNSLNLDLAPIAVKTFWKLRQQIFESLERKAGIAFIEKA
jgi:hypothetical protein